MHVMVMMPAPSLPRSPIPVVPCYCAPHIFLRVPTSVCVEPFTQMGDADESSPATRGSSRGRHGCRQLTPKRIWDGLTFKRQQQQQQRRWRMRQRGSKVDCATAAGSGTAVTSSTGRGLSPPTGSMGQLTSGFGGYTSPPPVVSAGQRGGSAAVATKPSRLEQTLHKCAPSCALAKERAP